ncbi:MAG: glycoside hydrolase family 16 protein [Actinobacteria bacterium]|nr:glycoside hydrolase family 16 protein [Actinomycetota bacterium]NBY15919.1 glycoside hydrolase family 16 protein [Actinomycetota bacterium]
MKGFTLMKSPRRSVIGAIAIVVALPLLIAPSVNSAAATSGKTAAVKSSYKLLWKEEFNGKTRAWPNENIWNYDIGNNGGWGNNENEYYTMSNARTDCGAITKTVKGKKKTVCTGNGSLVITANKIPPDSIEADSCANCSFFSARLNTQGKLGFKYGRIEARIKMPKGDGTWPALWLLGKNINRVNWPTCGEIDIVEVGTDPYVANSTIHGPVNFGAGGITNGGKQVDSPLYEGYHVFRMDWFPTKFVFYLDGVPHYTLTRSEVTGAAYNGRWVYDQEFFLILNLAMGGNYVGGTPDPMLKSAQMKVDYIRYFQIKQGSKTFGKLYRY